MAHALWMDPSIKLEQRARVCSTFNFIKTMPRFHEIESTGYLMLVTDLNLIPKLGVQHPEQMVKFNEYQTN